MIPVIDFKGPNVLDKIEEAYTTVGFAVFTNCLTEYEKTSMVVWSNKMKQFFNLSLEQKMQYGYEGVDNNIGYTMWLKENVDPNSPKDMKESFNYNDKRTTNWPKEIKDFKTTALESIDIADRLTLKILEKFDDILDSGTTIVDAHIPNYSTTRFIHYPAYKGSVEDKQLRIGEHSDYGTITLLWQINDVPGLQVQDLKGEWHPVPYDDDGVVCNIGDLLQRWTNDYFVSTKHRVVNSHINETRYSMPHFVDPAAGTIIKNLRNEPDKYEPIESKEYLTWRLAQSY
tara:strand:+ start:396 stop:1253 length:858 start_codon:yes stop_codon:yes gene_type:complete